MTNGFFSLHGLDDSFGGLPRVTGSFYSLLRLRADFCDLLRWRTVASAASAEGSLVSAASSGVKDAFNALLYTKGGFDSLLGSSLIGRGSSFRGLLGVKV